MSDLYVEHLVKTNRPMWAKVVMGLLWFLTVLLCILVLLTFNFIVIILAILCGVGAYFLGFFTDLEFEYLYLDKELSVDKVFSKRRRKKAATFELAKMEIVAPIKSYHLDDYKNRQVTVKDYSIRREEQPDLRYVFYYEGGLKVIISPSEEIIKAMHNVAPRKVFDN